MDERKACPNNKGDKMEDTLFDKALLLKEGIAFARVYPPEKQALFKQIFEIL